MEIYDVITLEDNKEYVILDIVDYQDNKYLYCVEIDKDENPIDEYIVAKLISPTEVEEVIDEELLKNLAKLFEEDMLKDDEQDV